MLNVDGKVIISSDIFDTLLFRLVSKPEDIFKLVAKEYENRYGKALAYDYVHIRKLAERKAREFEVSKEIHFEDIFDFIPYDIETKEILQKLEMEIEKDNLVINDEIYNFLKDCKDKGLTVILVSDMYFSEKQLREILAHVGCDMSLFSNVFVSSEYKASKANKDLYRIVKEQYTELSPNEILHIGDNYFSDYIAARKEGIESVHYTTFLETLDSTYALEEGWGGESVQELRNLRKKMKYSGTQYDDEQTRYYNLGSQIFGPVYSLYIDWVIDYAVKENIKNICPLMREGKLFGQMIQKAVNKRNLDIQVIPLYVSRKSTYLPSLKEFNAAVKKELLGRKMLKLEDLFGLLLLPIESTIFENYKRNNISEIYKIKIGNENVLSLLEKYLDEQQIISQINKNILSQKALLHKYITDKVGGESFITVDLAGHGSIQAQIDKVINNKEQAHHLMMLARIETLKKIIKGHQFSAWLGYDDLKNAKIRVFFRSPEIIEAVTNITEAGTSHYIEEDMIKPVKTNTVYPQKFVDDQNIIWNGILHFQQEWWKLDKQKHLKNRLLEKKEAFLNIFYRLINYPTYEEVRLLGSLLQDDQSHYSRIESIVTERDIALLREKGIEKFLALTSEGYSRSQVYWPQGAVAFANPNYFLMKYFTENQLDNSYMKIYELVSIISSNDFEKICVYGAGEIGKKILTLSKAYNLKIASFIDRNYNNMKDFMYGVPVQSIDYLDESVDLIIIASEAFYDEIKDTIIKHYDYKQVPKIMGLS